MYIMHIMYIMNSMYNTYTMHIIYIYMYITNGPKKYARSTDLVEMCMV